MYLSVALLQCLVSVASAQGLSKDWVSTNWDVWCPRADGPDLDPCEDQETAGTVFQDYLESSSQWYESLGFLGPKVVTKTGRYQAQIVRSEDAYEPDGESFAGVYDPSQYAIFLNEDNFFAMGEPGESTEAAAFRVEQSSIYTSVHEVFHAIQATYSHSACGDGRGWMCEGMADAALRAYADKFESEMNIAMERRPYHDPLHQPSQKEWQYGTWQFWLDVGRHLNSTDGIRYFRDILQRDLVPHNGLMGVDFALKSLMANGDIALEDESGLYDLLPWFFAKHDPDSIFLEPLRRSFEMGAGQTSAVKRIENIVVQPVAGRTVELTVKKPAGKAVIVKIAFGQPDDDLHLIVDNVRYDKAKGDNRNVYYGIIEEEQQRKLDVVIANVAKAAQMTRENDFDLVVELKPEGASMGAEPPTTNPATLAAAIDAPLEIEFDNYHAVVQTGLARQVGDQFIGVAQSEGLINPCLLQVTARGEIEPGRHFAQMFGVMLQASGAITPGDYPIAPFKEFSGNYVEMLPDGQAEGGVLLYDMPENRNDLQWESGWLSIDQISPRLVVGRISGVANNRELSDVTGNYEIIESRTLAAKFSIRVRGVVGEYRDGAYPCIGPAEN
jgi:hypothetical protein